MKTDKYGHLIGEGRETDPYGGLEFAVGSGDDFICYDFNFFSENNITYFVLHSVLNSETGCFIQDFQYDIIDNRDCKAIGDFEVQVSNLIDNVLSQTFDWLADNEVTHSKKGWNQDPYYWARRIAYHLAKNCGHEYDWNKISNRQFRLGGKRINHIVNQILDREIIYV